MTLIKYVIEIKYNVEFYKLQTKWIAYKFEKGDWMDISVIIIISFFGLFLFLLISFKNINLLVWLVIIMVSTSFILVYDYHRWKFISWVEFMCLRDYL